MGVEQHLLTETWTVTVIGDIGIQGFFETTRCSGDELKGLISSSQEDIRGKNTSGGTSTRLLHIAMMMDTRTTTTVTIPVPADSTIETDAATPHPQTRQTRPKR